MKVLHVVPSISPLLGGPTQVVLKLVRTLREQGIDAEIVTTNDNGPDLLEVPLGQRIEYEQVPIWFFHRFSPRLKEFIFSADLTRWLWQYSRDYDLIDSHYLFSYASTCAAAVARWQEIPYTVRTIGQLAPWALSQSWLKKQIYASVIERRNLNRAAVIHCTSIGEAKDVRKFGIQTPKAVLPLGVDLPILWPEAKQKLHALYSIPASTPIVLFLARLHPKKRPDLLLRALSQLAAQGYDFHVLVAGSGSQRYSTELQQLIASLGLATRSSLPGFVLGQDKDLLLQGSDIFVLPSFAENFGVAVAEAMAAGLPVVITPEVQISPDIAAQQAGIVVEGEVAPLAQALAQLLTSPELRHQMGQNGQRLVTNQYTWSAIAQDLVLLYQAIIERKPLPESLVVP